MLRTILAFTIGAAVGAGAAVLYFRAHALELTAEGIGEKIFGVGSTGSKVIRGIAGAVEGLN